MQYNSEKELLIYPEYGRHIQGLIQSSVNIESDEERQAYIEQIIRLIEQMNPEYRSIENARLKIWQNIFNILGTEVELEYPDAVDKSPETERYNKAHSMVYPHRSNKYRHYGTNVRKLLDKAIEMEDPVKKKMFVDLIGSYMKMVHRNWNNEKFMSDEVIKNDIERISEKKITFEKNEDVNFKLLDKPARNQRKVHSNRKYSRGRKKKR